MMSLTKVRKSVPWYVKMTLKLIRAKVPLNYHFFANLGIFKHGKMDNPTYAITTFNNHFTDKDIPSGPWVFAEIGPGDSLFSGIIAFSKGARLSYIIDYGDFISRDIQKYHRFIEVLFGKKFLDENPVQNLEDIKRVFSIVHLTEGVASMEKLPADLIDLSFSNACLEHVYKTDIEPLFIQLKRVSRQNSISSHFIDFKDHLSYSLNNLRFSEEFWESELLKKSTMYTNRCRLSDFEKIFERNGISYRLVRVEKWNGLPLKHSKLHEKFKNYSVDDLLVKEAWVRICG